MAGEGLVWYVSYGSNMHAGRLACYLAGGTAPGTTVRCPGARDPRPPRRGLGVWLAGGIYFATHSQIWLGGRAFYDPDLPGRAAARAWLVSVSQFSDIAAQEMHREPGGDLDLTDVLAHGRAQLGPGRYETLLRVGEIDGYPQLTFTAPWRAADVPATAPSAAYLRMLAAGLAAAHGWDTPTIADYLAARPGAAGNWATAAVAELLNPEC
ncbi:MAG: histone deacetylase [Sciscionella sp.]